MESLLNSLILHHQTLPVEESWASLTRVAIFSGQDGSWRLKKPTAAFKTAPAYWRGSLLRQVLGTWAKYSSAKISAAIRHRSSCTKGKRNGIQARWAKTLAASRIGSASAQVSRSRRVRRSPSSKM